MRATGLAGAALALARGPRRELGFLLSLRVLPPRVALFQWRARRLAVRTGDEFSTTSFTRPRKLAILLQAARGRRQAAELGTATGWTALSLLLDDPHRRVLGLDPYDRPERERYLRLVGPSVRARARFRAAPGEAGPGPGEHFDLLYIDSSHAREDTIAEYRAWRASLAPGGVVVFDDFGHRDFPGVRQAVLELGLDGEEREGLFIHRVPPSSRPRP